GSAIGVGDKSLAESSGSGVFARDRDKADRSRRRTTEDVDAEIRRGHLPGLVYLNQTLAAVANIGAVLGERRRVALGTREQILTIAICAVCQIEQSIARALQDFGECRAVNVGKRTVAHVH